MDEDPIDAFKVLSLATSTTRRVLTAQCAGVGSEGADDAAERFDGVERRLHPRPDLVARHAAAARTQPPQLLAYAALGPLVHAGIALALAAERLDVAFQVADVEALPFADASFDAVVSTFGVMFAPDHARSADEMARVVRPGGRIGLANWTPEGFIGRLFKVIGAHLPPPPYIYIMWFVTMSKFY